MTKKETVIMILKATRNALLNTTILFIVALALSQVLATLGVPITTAGVQIIFWLLLLLFLFRLQHKANQITEATLEITRQHNQHLRETIKGQWGVIDRQRDSLAETDAQLREIEALYMDTLTDYESYLLNPDFKNPYDIEEE